MIILSRIITAGAHVTKELVKEQTGSTFVDMQEQDEDPARKWF